MGSQMSDSETCYALVIGTENGTATLILLKIEEPIFEANLLVISMDGIEIGRLSNHVRI